MTRVSWGVDCVSHEIKLCLSDVKILIDQLGRQAKMELLQDIMCELGESDWAILHQWVSEIS